MEQRRLELHELLCGILGSRNCYYSPPNGFFMSYPCIVYDLNVIDTREADNFNYKRAPEYSVTIIDENPDSDLPNKLLDLPHSRFDRSFKSDNLNHFVFRIYY